MPTLTLDSARRAICELAAMRSQSRGAGRYSRPHAMASAHRDPRPSRSGGSHDGPRRPAGRRARTEAERPRRNSKHRAMHRLGEARFSPARVWAMLLRYLYILRSSWPRTLELLYWPTLQMLIWGFMSQFLAQNTSYVAQAFGVLLAAVMLWDLLFRSQLGLSISFLEEMWSRNLGQLFVTPLRPYEWVLSLLAMSVIRVTIGIVPAMLLAIPLYHYSIFDMGLALAAFIARADGDGLGAGAGDLRRHPASRHGRREPGLDRDLRDRAAELRLLSADDPAGMAAARSPGRCLRRMSSRACARCCSSTFSAPIISCPQSLSIWFIWRSARRSSSSPSATQERAARCCRWASDHANSAARTALRTAGGRLRSRRAGRRRASGTRLRSAGQSRPEQRLDIAHRPALRGAAARCPRRAAAPS